MNSLNVSTEDALNPGEIKFFSSCRPPLLAGDYHLIATQTVEKLKDKLQPPSYSQTQPFRIAGPRFKLDVSDIQMVYPPANQPGNYTNTLANIVLRRRTLPWERAIAQNPNPAESEAPWVALLTVYKGELTSDKPVPMKVSDILAPPEASVLPPQLQNVPDDEQQQTVLALDVPIDFFLGIAPELNELKYLAHVREVNTDGKVILGLQEDGYFSVVVSNRVAKAGTDQTVFLVSLEGHQNHLPNGPTINFQYKQIRLAVLATWSFTAEPSPGDFIGLMQALPKRGGVKLLQMPYTFEEPITESETFVKEALDIGYIPLANDMRVGEKTTSWYRGPLVPVITKRDTTNGPYLFSDHAIHYDPQTGLFNLAYAAAWQIGRLLALSDASFARALFNWRHQSYSQMQQLEQQSLYRQRLQRSLAFSVPANQLLNQSEFQEGLLHFWLQQVESLTAPGAEIPLVQLREKRLDPRGLPGVLSPEAIATAFASDREPLQALCQMIFAQ